MEEGFWGKPEIRQIEYSPQFGFVESDKYPAVQIVVCREGPTANASRTQMQNAHPQGPSTGRYHPLCV